MLRYIAEDAPSGYGDAADRLVLALRNSGMRVEYRAWANGHDGRPPGINRHSRDARPFERAAPDAPTIVHLVPEYYPSVRAALPAGQFVAHTVWETDELPRHWAELLNGAGRVVVPTEWNRATFEASGVVAPVVVVPHVACEPVPGDRGAPLAVPDDTVVFYTIGRWDQRKAPAAVIRSFLEAFTADDPVALVVKTSPLAQFPPPSGWGDTSPLLGTTAFEVLRITRSYPHPPLIRVEVDDWTPARVAGLHHRGDCYVSLSHGEGWALGAFDAAAYGNPVVMTGWGGQLAFLDPDHSFLVEYDLEPTRHFEPRSYGPYQQWAVPRLEHAVAVLREVAADIAAARRRVAPLRRTVLHDFAGPRVVAELLDATPEVASVVDEARANRPGSSLRRYADPTAVLADRLTGTTLRRGTTIGDALLLVGVTAGPWQSAFDNWIEMAERHGYRYEVIGQEVEQYEAHFTKWRLLVDFFEDLARERLVFYLDASDGFVCDGPARTLARYRSYRAPLVLSAEDARRKFSGFDAVPDPTWRFGNAGGFLGEAGVVADALREGYRLEDWQAFGRVSDQHAMIRYLTLPEHRHLATLDFRRVIVENIMASTRREELAQHRVMLEHGAGHACTSSVHFYGGNGRGYNAFAELYGLPGQELAESGWFRVSAPVAE